VFVPPPLPEVVDIQLINACECYPVHIQIGAAGGLPFTDSATVAENTVKHFEARSGSLVKIEIRENGDETTFNEFRIDAFPTNDAFGEPRLVDISLRLDRQFTRRNNHWDPEPVKEGFVGRLQMLLGNGRIMIIVPMTIPVIQTAGFDPPRPFQPRPAPPAPPAPSSPNRGLFDER
jgi:hypothetical protein